jgi:O-acetyl-ADP-ribose deacetylase (regulator of RNase III)
VENWWAPVIAGGVCLVGGLVLLLWAVRPARAGERHAVASLAWLLAAVGVASILFSLFPASTANGTLLGISLTGAAAFTALLWWAAMRLHRNLQRTDQVEAELQQCQAQVHDLEQQLTAAAAPAERPEVLRQHERVLFTLRGRRKRIGIVTGDVSRVRNVDVWVNSENTRMQMSRIDEPTLSATIRYLGAELDPFGEITGDLVADALRAATGGRSVEPGSVLVTTAGRLRESHSVARIMHVAAVRGEPGRGYRQIDDLGAAARRVLALAEEVQVDGRPVSSILLPLLGAGSGHGTVQRTAEILVDAVLAYLDEAAGTHIDTVWFLGSTAASFAALRHELESSARLSPAGSATSARVR